MSSVQDHLLSLRDEKNAAFAAKLTPNIPKETIFGIRLPILRAYAKELFKSAEAERFLRELPHRYFDENNLHAFLLMCNKDFSACMEAVETFLPYVDNWATCDSLRPSCFKKNLPALHKKAEVWIRSAHTYTVRFGIGMLMCHFLGDAFSENDLALVASVRSEEYYIHMMIAWYFATALAKRYDETLPYIEKRLLDDRTHRKTIQKALESYRIDDDRKAYLKTLR